MRYVDAGHAPKVSIHLKNKKSSIQKRGDMHPKKTEIVLIAKAQVLGTITNHIVVPVVKGGAIY